jgi:hypothetical protein
LVKHNSGLLYFCAERERRASKDQLDRSENWVLLQGKGSYWCSWGTHAGRAFGP